MLLHYKLGGRFVCHVPPSVAKNALDKSKLLRSQVLRPCIVVRPMNHACWATSDVVSISERSMVHRLHMIRTFHITRRQFKRLLLVARGDSFCR